jgi:hypothetical protein
MNLIVFGIAPCLEEDLKNLSEITNIENWDFLAVGLDAATRLTNRIQHVATYHPKELVQFRERRKQARLNLNYLTHSHTVLKNQEIDHVWPLVARSPFSGSSAFLGCQAGVGLGYEKIVLCGCPLQGKKLDSKSEIIYDKFQKGWEKFAKEMFGDSVRSMSGWTRDFLGFPTKEWLDMAENI